MIRRKESVVTILQGVVLAVTLTTLLPITEVVDAASLAQQQSRNGRSWMWERAKAGKDAGLVVMVAELLHIHHPSSPFISSGSTSPPPQHEQRGAPRSDNGSLAWVQTSEMAYMKESVVDGLRAGVRSLQYFLKMGVGTPAKDVYWMLDTGSSLTWVQCLRGGAAGPPGFRPLPFLFNSTASSSFDRIPCPSDLCSALPFSQGCSDRGECKFFVQYIDGSSARGVLAQDSFTFDESTLQPVMFGCTEAITGEHGQDKAIVGFGANFFSVPSQSGGNLFFCLPRRLNGRTVTTGMAGIGDLDFSHPTTIFTRLIHSRTYASFHMVPLVGISINGKLLDGLDASSFSTDQTPEGAPKHGAMLDSGSVMTYLPPHAYLIVRDAFREAATAHNLKAINVDSNTINGPDTCYHFDSALGPTPDNTPSLELHFEGGQSISLPPHNILFPTTPTLGIYCLSFRVTSLPIGTLGSVQLSSFFVSIDTRKMIVGFTPNQC